MSKPVLADAVTLEAPAQDLCQDTALREIDRKLMELIAERIRLCNTQTDSEGADQEETARKGERILECIKEGEAHNLRPALVREIWQILSDEADRTDKDESTQLAASAMRIDHIAVAVRDLEEAIAIYQDQYGFLLERRVQTEGEFTGMVSAVLRAGAVKLVLVQGTSERSQVSKFIDHFGPGIQHVALEVSGIDDVCEKLTDKGVPFLSKVIRGPGLNQLFTLRDKTTNLQLEFIERSGNANFAEGNINELFRSMEKANAF